MNESTLQKLEFYGQHFSDLLNLCCHIVDTQKQCFLGEPCREHPDFCPFCRNEDCALLNTCLYGVHEAYRWGGKYIFYCPESFIFIASSVSDEDGALCGGLVLGPIIMGELEDTAELYSDTELRKSALAIANLSTENVNHIAEILAGVTEGISGASHSFMGSIAFKQENFLETLYQTREETDFSGSEVYPIDTEKELQAVIRDGDKSGAQRLLNDLLGKIYLLSDFDPDLVKIRIIELLSVLSRAAIDAGAETGEIMWFNTACIREMQKCGTIEELSVWITGAMRRFLSYSFDFSSVKHSDTVYKVIDYIRRNYFQKISLDDIAKYVNFSKTYLSRIFKEETGENISSYINRIRVERAKLLLSDPNIPLVDVAALTGFEDQSYFTKVFKSVTNQSPKNSEKAATGCKEELPMERKEYLEEISSFLQKGRTPKVKELVRQALDDNISAKDILEEGLLAGMSIIGEKFKNNEVFVPEVLIAARAMNGGVEILKPYLVEAGVETKGVVVIGTVKGDLHDIGKNLVKMMMEGKGLEVVDLGVDVSPEAFVAAAKEHNADIISCSALLTTTMGEMKNVVDLVKADPELAGKVKVMVGGAPVTEAFCQKIGADCYTSDAASASDAALAFCQA